MPESELEHFAKQTSKLRADIKVRVSNLREESRYELDGTDEEHKDHHQV